jgi:hypothetical protein
MSFRLMEKYSYDILAFLQIEPVVIFTYVNLLYPFTYLHFLFRVFFVRVLLFFPYSYNNLIM